jgi:hypothetical protein
LGHDIYQNGITSKTVSTVGKTLAAAGGVAMLFPPAGPVIGAGLALAGSFMSWWGSAPAKPERPKPRSLPPPPSKEEVLLKKLEGMIDQLETNQKEMLKGLDKIDFKLLMYFDFRK